MGIMRNNMDIDVKHKKNTIYSIIKSVSAIIFPLITFPYSSRVLGVENYGKLNFANSIIVYFALFASLGIATYAIRECAKVKDNRQELSIVASQLYSINLASTLLSYLFLIVALLVSYKLRNYLLLICIYSSSIVFNTAGAEWINIALGEYKYITIRGLLSNLVSIILMFIFVHDADDYIVLAIITATATSGANVMNIFYRRKFCSVKPTFHVNLKKHLPPILLMFAIILVQEVFVASDTTIIGFLLDDKAVGLYSAATKIYRLPSAITNSLSNVLLPTLSVAFAINDTEQIKKTLRYGVNFLSLIGFPCVAGLIIFSKEIIGLSSSDQYISAATTLSILGVSYLATLFGMVVTNFIIIANKKDKVCFWSCLVSAIINIVLNFIFIPIYGIVAAAFTTALSNIVVVLIELPYIKRGLFDRSVISVIIKPLIATIILVGWLFLTKILVTDRVWVVVVGVIAGALLYFLANILMKEEMTTDFCVSILHKIKKKNSK